MRMRVTRSWPRSGGAGRRFLGLGKNLGDDLVGLVATPAALELAAHRAVGALRVAVPAAGGGANIGFANQIARANDHAVIMPLMRGVRKREVDIAARGRVEGK